MARSCEPFYDCGETNGRNCQTGFATWGVTMPLPNVDIRALLPTVSVEPRLARDGFVEHRLDRRDQAGIEPL